MDTSSEKKAYEKPQLIIVTFKTEHGYAFSSFAEMLGFAPDYGDEQLESRTDGGNWGGSGEWI